MCLQRALLILDLDETLIWASAEPEARPFDFRVAEYSVVKRPFLSGFLDGAFEWFDVAVWTSSSAGYAESVVAEVFQGRPALKFVWTRTRCTQQFDPETRAHHFLKDLKKVKRRGFDLDRILMVDDSPEKLARNYGNHLWLAPFEGQADDRELADVVPFLGWIKDEPNFRAIEKRNWRSRKFD